MYLGEQLSELCCDDCAAGEPCSGSVHGLGFSIAPPWGLGQSTFLSDLQEAINFVPPSGMSEGVDILNGVAAGANLVPGVGPLASSVVSIFSSAFSALGSWLHLGAGRKEADVITGPPNHVQDQVFNQIVAISKIGLPSNSIPQLQGLIIELRQLRSAWLTFLGNTSHFHDGRASAQAADTIMPYLDGTCGYHWPPPLNPGQFSGCGGAWPGDFGYGAGLLGALEARLIQIGGTLPPPQITQGGPLGIPQLQVPIPGQAVIPEPGTLPPVSPLPIVPIQSAGVFPVGGSNLPLVIGGAAALLFLMRFRS